MTVATTSATAYRDHKETGRVSAQQQTILDALQDGFALSRREIADETGLELSSVCGRVNELLQIGLLVEVRARQCNLTGRTVRPVMIAATVNHEGAE